MGVQREEQNMTFDMVLPTRMYCWTNATDLGKVSPPMNSITLSDFSPSIPYSREDITMEWTQWFISFGAYETEGGLHDWVDTGSRWTDYFTLGLSFKNHTWTEKFFKA